VKKFVAVAGNIGVGKSTLVTLLSQSLGWQAFYEPEGDNPYLADFYQDMRQWAFQSQVFFLARRLQTHRQVLDHRPLLSRTAACMKMQRYLLPTCTIRA
jgi:deoxyadenosine/deoxycytidine kinase